MSDAVDAYKYAQLNEVLGGVLEACKDGAALVAVADGPVVEELPCTDSLMQIITQRLFKPAKPYGLSEQNCKELFSARHFL